MNINQDNTDKSHFIKKIESHCIMKFSNNTLIIPKLSELRKSIRILEPLNYTSARKPEVVIYSARIPIFNNLNEQSKETLQRYMDNRVKAIGELCR